MVRKRVRLFYIVGIETSEWKMLHSIWNNLSIFMEQKNMNVWIASILGEGIIFH